MLTALVALFSSSGIGALIGAIGGLANRWLDMQDKKLELLDRQRQREHDLSILSREIEGRTQVAIIEGESQIESAGYAALGESYKADKATYGIKSIDWVRGAMRPLITLVFLVVVGYINYKVWQILNTSELVLTADQLFEIIRWTLFEASVVIGWWFAMRPTGNAGLRLAGK